MGPLRAVRLLRLANLTDLYTHVYASVSCGLGSAEWGWLCELCFRQMLIQ